MAVAEEARAELEHRLSGIPFEGEFPDSRKNPEMSSFWDSGMLDFLDSPNSSHEKKKQFLRLITLRIPF